MKNKIEKKKIKLSGKKWLQNSVSIWDDIRKSPEELRLKHPALFPAMLCNRLIETFSDENDLILDPFAGTGSTIISASNLNRNAIGVELSSKYIKLYESRQNQLHLFKDNFTHNVKMIKADANKLLSHVKSSSVRLTITSPPYWDILKQKRTADGKEKRDYGNNKKDLGTITSYTKFLSELKNIFNNVFEVTVINGYCCIILMDLRKGKKFYPFHIDTINFMQELGFELDDIIIWNRKHEYNNLRPLGYPYVFRVNKVHEFILIFQKLPN